MFQNIVWIVFALTVAGAFMYRLKTAHRSASGNRLMVGVILVSLSAVAHRGYWTIWRWSRDAYGSDSPQAVWFVNNADWVGICVAVIALGYSLHLYTVFRKWMGRLWWTVPASMLGASYFLATTLAS